MLTLTANYFGDVAQRFEYQLSEIRQERQGHTYTYIYRDMYSQCTQICYVYIHNTYVTLSYIAFCVVSVRIYYIYIYIALPSQLLGPPFNTPPLMITYYRHSATTHL